MWKRWKSPKTTPPNHPRRKSLTLPSPRSLMVVTSTSKSWDPVGLVVVLVARVIPIKFIGTEKLERLMTELNTHCKSAAAQTPISLKPGDLIAAKYPADNSWYRAKVKRVLPIKQVEIYFVDYGNVGGGWWSMGSGEWAGWDGMIDARSYFDQSDTVAVANTRNLGPGMATLPGQAVEAFLSFVQVPAPGEDYGAEALELASELLQVGSLKQGLKQGW